MECFLYNSISLSGMPDNATFFLVMAPCWVWHRLIIWLDPKNTENQNKTYLTALTG